MERLCSFMSGVHMLPSTDLASTLRNFTSKLLPNSSFSQIFIVRSIHSLFYFFLLLLLSLFSSSSSLHFFSFVHISSSSSFFLLSLSNGKRKQLFRVLFLANFPHSRYFRKANLVKEVTYSFPFVFRNFFQRENIFSFRQGKEVHCIVF